MGNKVSPWHGTKPKPRPASGNQGPMYFVPVTNMGREYEAVDEFTTVGKEERIRLIDMHIPRNTRIDYD